ncbi:GON-4-like protein isoform X1 [Sapajus apella]|uniref:GON-4-like protein isoform X1 n=1 Tax=Sapajus apella TaxID=9515 RepID=A0A6J3GTN5_SAPAP|nr:GON-4-like protein isoform X1 [Sapajus apella]XP_032121045.1 GON-4-like protein isoform X1 [Sapajus apella]
MAHHLIHQRLFSFPPKLELYYTLLRETRLGLRFSPAPRHPPDFRKRERAKRQWTRDAGRRHVSGKPDTQERWLPSSRARVKTRDRTSPVHESPSGIDTSETSPKAPRGGLAKDSGTQGKGPEGEQQPKATEATVCANNSKVSSTGEKVVLWTREADRVILTMCQEQGAQPQTFSIISQQLGNKTPAEVSGLEREKAQQREDKVAN